MIEVNKITNKILNGDALEHLKTFPDNCIDCVITDPPYMIRKQIIIHRSMNPKKYKYVGKDIITGGWDWDSQWETEKEYLDWVKIWFKEIVRILKDGGHFLCCFDRLKQWWLYEWGNEFGMITRQPLYFILSNPVPRARCVDFMGAVCSIFWSTKKTYSRKISTFNWKLGQHRNYVDVSITPTPRDRERHPTEKNIKVIEWLLNYLTKENDIILDPFLGSGTTAVACLKLNRKFIGIEINPKYVKMAEERIQPYLEQTKLT